MRIFSSFPIWLPDQIYMQEGPCTQDVFHHWLRLKKKLVCRWLGSNVELRQTTKVAVSAKYWPMGVVRTRIDGQGCRFERSLFGQCGLWWFFEMAVGVTFLNACSTTQSCLYSRIALPALTGHLRHLRATCFAACRMADKLPLCAISHSCTDVDRSVAGVDAQNYTFVPS